MRKDIEQYCVNLEVPESSSPFVLGAQVYLRSPTAPFTAPLTRKTTSPLYAEPGRSDPRRCRADPPRGGTSGASHGLRPCWRTPSADGLPQDGPLECNWNSPNSSPASGARRAGTRRSRSPLHLIRARLRAERGAVRTRAADGGRRRSAARSRGYRGSGRQRIRDRDLRAIGSRRTRFRARRELEAVAEMEPRPT